MADHHFSGGNTDLPSEQRAADSAERLEREEFEAWARDRGFSLHMSLIAPGDYSGTRTKAAWAGWQAARRAPAEAGVGWHALTDEDRQAAFESLPDMLEGFLKKWGWLCFAKEIERRCREKNAAPTAPA